MRGIRWTGKLLTSAQSLSSKKFFSSLLLTVSFRFSAVVICYVLIGQIFVYIFQITHNTPPEINNLCHCWFMWSVRHFRIQSFQFDLLAQIWLFELIYMKGKVMLDLEVTLTSLVNNRWEISLGKCYNNEVLKLVIRMSDVVLVYCMYVCK